MKTKHMFLTINDNITPPKTCLCKKLNSKHSKSTEDEERELRSAGLSLLLIMQAVGSHRRM